MFPRIGHTPAHPHRIPQHHPWIWCPSDQDLVSRMSLKFLHALSNHHPTCIATITLWHLALHTVPHIDSASAALVSPRVDATSSPASSGTTSPNSAMVTPSTSPVFSPLSTTIPSSSTRSFKHPIQAPQDYMHTRSKSGIFVPKKHFNLFASHYLSPILSNYRSALKDPNWLSAMREKYNSLMN
jgi:hypothetical protein